MIIDSTYFIGDINQPGVQNPWVVSGIDTFITRREPEYLKLALSYGMYKLFIEGIAASGARWMALRDGADYTDGKGQLQQWQGFTTKGNSAIADYVYFWYVRDNASQTTTTGEVKPGHENAASVSPLRKMRDAWYSMVRHTHSMWAYLCHAKDDAGALLYPEFDFKAIDRTIFNPINPLT